MRKLTREEAQKKLPDHVELLDYVPHGVCPFYCEKHNHEFKGSLGKQCKFCLGRLVDEEVYVNRLEEMNHILFPIEKFIDNKTPINHKCSCGCGNIYTKSPRKVIANNQCGGRGFFS